MAGFGNNPVILDPVAEANRQARKELAAKSGYNAPQGLRTVWLVYKTNDDGKPTTRVGVCSTESNANLVAQNQGGWGPGGAGKVEQAQAIIHPLPGHTDQESRAYIIDGDPLILDEHVEAKMAEIREKALQKLSSAERRALGLPDPA
jgi:hypothetical protein